MYVNGGQLQLTDHYSVGGGFEYFWTRNFSSTIYGGYTRFEYNSTVVNNRLFCGGANGFTGGAQGFTGVRRATCDPSYSLWQVGTHHDWFPLPGLRFAVDVLYTRVESDMAGQTVTLTRPALQRVWAPVRPAPIRSRTLASSRSCSAPSAPGAPTDIERQS